MTVIGDVSVEEDGLAAACTTVTVVANDSGVVETRLHLTKHSVMQKLSTY